MAEASSDPSIASCGRSCSMLLPQLVGSLVESSLQDQLSSASVKKESKRFELWARNIAALQDAHLPSSLEHRLRDDASARGIVKKALLYLEESLQMALSIASGERENEVWDLPSPDEQPAGTYGQPNLGSSELKELGLAIQEGITNLFQLSMIIRKRPEKDEYVKASLTYTIDPTFDIVHVGDKYPPAKKGDKWLMERLGIAITRRRQYLLYRKEHQEKMEQVHTLKKDVDGKTVWSGEKASTYHPNEALEDSRPVDLNIGGLVSSARTNYADSSKGKDGASDLLRTPLLPKDSVGVRAEYNQHFECPYCWRPQKVGNKNEWKKHIFGDLRPYVCTFESCGLNMFESQNQWFEHEMRFHRKQWRCQHCKEATAQTRPELEKHTTLAHPDKVQEGHIDTLLDACQIPRIDATECPLCTFYGEKLQRINQSKKCDVSLKQFQEHLGRHMEQLALSALPQEEVDEDDGPASDDAESVDTTTKSVEHAPLFNEDDKSDVDSIFSLHKDDASASSKAQGGEMLDGSNSEFKFGIDPSINPELAEALEKNLKEGRKRIDAETERQKKRNTNLPPGDTSEDEIPLRVIEPADDTLLLKFKGDIFKATFPAYSIGDGILRVDDIKNRAAAWYGIRYSRLKLLYKGQQLEEDRLPARDYGIKNMSEILVIIDNDGLVESSSGHDSDDQERRGRVKPTIVDERPARGVATVTDGDGRPPTKEINSEPVPVLDDDIEWGPFGIKETNKKVVGTDESSKPEPVIEERKEQQRLEAEAIHKKMLEEREAKVRAIYLEQERVQKEEAEMRRAAQEEAKRLEKPEPVMEDDVWPSITKKSKKDKKGKAVVEDDLDIDLGQAPVEEHDGNDGSQPQIKPDPIPEPVADDDWGWGARSSKKKNKKGKNVEWEPPTEERPSNAEPPLDPPPTEPGTLDADDGWGGWGAPIRKKKKGKKVASESPTEESPSNVETAPEPPPTEPGALNADDGWGGWGGIPSKKKKKGKKVAPESPTEASPWNVETAPDPCPPEPETLYADDDWGGWNASAGKKDKKKRKVEFPIDDEKLTTNTTQSTQPAFGEPHDREQPRYL